MWRKLLDALPHGHYLAEEDWRRRHRLMLWILGLHVPALIVLGLLLGYPPRTVVLATIAPLVLVTLGHLLRHHRRPASVAVTAGLVYCSAALVAFTHGTIEAHFHFFVIIGFIALYQDWAPFLFNIVFTVISHGIGSAWQRDADLRPRRGAGEPLVVVADPRRGRAGRLRRQWSLVLADHRGHAAGEGRAGPQARRRRDRAADVHVRPAGQPRPAQPEPAATASSSIINQLEESERDPDALAELFALDHLATRVRRNAESLLVLSGEQPPRTWSEPVPLRDVVRAAIAETEDLDRVVFVVDERAAVVGHAVTDLTHLLAELTENAVRFSPPDTAVTIRARPDRRHGPAGSCITVEDWGVGMPADELAAANALLADPPEVDLSVSQRLGFHVVARLAARHGIKVTLTATPGSGITAARVRAAVAPRRCIARPAASEPRSGRPPSRSRARRRPPTRPDRPVLGIDGPTARLVPRRPTGGGTRPSRRRCAASNPTAAHRQPPSRPRDRRAARGRWPGDGTAPRRRRPDGRRDRAEPGSARRPAAPRPPRPARRADRPRRRPAAAPARPAGRASHPRVRDRLRRSRTRTLPPLRTAGAGAARRARRVPAPRGPAPGEPARPTARATRG